MNYVTSMSVLLTQLVVLFASIPSYTVIYLVILA
jgi:hypothetical protein